MAEKERMMIHPRRRWNSSRKMFALILVFLTSWWLYWNFGSTKSEQKLYAEKKLFYKGGLNNTLGGTGSRNTLRNTRANRESMIMIRNIFDNGNNSMKMSDERDESDEEIQIPTLNRDNKESTEMKTNIIVKEMAGDMVKIDCEIQNTLQIKCQIGLKNFESLDLASQTQTHMSRNKSLVMFIGSNDVRGKSTLLSSLYKNKNFDIFNCGEIDYGTEPSILHKNSVDLLYLKNRHNCNCHILDVYGNIDATSRMNAFLSFLNNLNDTSDAMGDLEVIDESSDNINDKDGLLYIFSTMEHEKTGQNINVYLVLENKKDSNVINKESELKNGVYDIAVTLKQKGLLFKILSLIVTIVVAVWPMIGSLKIILGTNFFVLITYFVAITEASSNVSNMTGTTISPMVTGEEEEEVVVLVILFALFALFVLMAGIVWFFCKHDESRVAEDNGTIVTRNDKKHVEAERNSTKNKVMTDMAHMQDDIDNENKMDKKTSDEKQNDFDLNGDLDEWENETPTTNLKLENKITRVISSNNSDGNGNNDIETASPTLTMVSDVVLRHPDAMYPKMNQNQIGRNETPQTPLISSNNNNNNGSDSPLSSKWDEINSMDNNGNNSDYGTTDMEDENKENKMDEKMNNESLNCDLDEFVTPTTNLKLENNMSDYPNLKLKNNLISSNNSDGNSVEIESPISDIVLRNPDAYDMYPKRNDETPLISSNNRNDNTSGDCEKWDDDEINSMDNNGNNSEHEFGTTEAELNIKQQKFENDDKTSLADTATSNKTKISSLMVTYTCPIEDEKQDTAVASNNSDDNSSDEMEDNDNDTISEELDEIIKFLRSCLNDNDNKKLVARTSANINGAHIQRVVKGSKFMSLNERIEFIERRVVIKIFGQIAGTLHAKTMANAILEKFD